MIGLKRGTVRLLRHTPEWHKNFEREAKKLRRVLGRDALDVQHVGSTAITGILAKSVIDIALIVPSLKKSKQYLVVLKRAGYTLKKRDDRAERLFFTKGLESKRTHYLHVGQAGSRYVEDMIFFRDYLRAHPTTARKYSALKARLAQQYKTQRKIYSRKKEFFVKSIIRKAK